MHRHHTILIPARKPSSTEKLGDDDRAAHIAAEGKGNKNQSDFITIAHGGQRVFADKFSCHKAVRYIVELLENNTAKKRKTELPQYSLGFSNGQIFVHKSRSFPNPKFPKPYYNLFRII